MAITQASLSTKLQTEIIAAMGSSPTDAAQLKKMCDAIAKAVVDEIHANAVVQVNGVQSGSDTGIGTIL